MAVMSPLLETFSRSMVPVNDFTFLGGMSQQVAILYCACWLSVNVERFGKYNGDCLGPLGADNSFRDLVRKKLKDLSNSWLSVQLLLLCLTKYTMHDHLAIELVRLIQWRPNPE